MLPSDTTPVSYVGDGPQFDGESPADAWAENTANHLAGHLLRPGESIEDEPTDAAEKDSARLAQEAASATQAAEKGRA